MEGCLDNEFILQKPYRVRDLLFENYGFHPVTYG